MNLEPQVVDAPLKEQTSAMDATDSDKRKHKGAHDRGLLLIGLFKLAKSLFFF